MYSSQNKPKETRERKLQNSVINNVVFIVFELLFVYG